MLALRSLTHAFGETLGIRQCFDGALNLWIVVQQYSRSVICIEGRCNDLFAYPHFHELQLGINLRLRETCGRIRFHKVAERFNNSVADWIIRALRGAIILDFVDTIRLE